MKTNCNICGCTFANNKGGQLTNHLLQKHNINVKDYYILTILNNCPPVCACGYCEQEPEFYRGNFKKYAKGHNTFVFRQEQYKVKYGTPKCKVCGCDVSFKRGKPNKYCSIKCGSKEHTSKPEERQRRSLYAKNNLAGKYFSTKNKFSNLHLKIRKQLLLQELGFVGEQKVDRFLVDEFNKEKKFIIEINGDYVHANPNIYNANDIIRLPGNSYTAEEKWFTDKIKINKLKELGYKVFIIWESDDIEQVKQNLRLQLT